ncbi:MAG: hypothetical protein HRT37_04455 [Alteromonadaceae bacterium]|nr:hypothetical protein [Alteromonadaceae bacterium]
MSIEIKELVIKAVVDQTSMDNQSQSFSEDNLKKVISACVEQILGILERENQR